MTSFTGQDMLKTAVRVGTGMMEPFGMMGEARLDTAFSSSDSLELHKFIISFLLEMILKQLWTEAPPDDLLGGGLVLIQVMEFYSS